MRHSDPRLTANLYTDVSHLPTFDIVQDLDWIEEPQETPSEDIPERPLTGTYTGTQNIVFDCHFLSQSGTTKFKETSRETPCRINQKTARSLDDGGQIMVGETGFEPATSASQTQRSTKLSYSPINEDLG